MTSRHQGARVSNTELEVSRVIEAPRPLVFELFTDADHLGRWWGPVGFSITTHSFEFRPGGVWEFIMHGADGTDYPNWIQWDEISAPEVISLRHGSAADDPEMFRSTITFVSTETGTEVILRSRFQTRELCDRAVEEFGALQGGEETLGRLAAYVAASDQRRR